MMAVAVVAAASLAVFAITFGLLWWLARPEQPEPDAPFFTVRERLEHVWRQASLLGPIRHHQPPQPARGQAALAQPVTHARG
jgi:sterol desaturase/sphingolipid hydroxylase (fatty acid hydroxylase superfamily)